MRVYIQGVLDGIHTEADTAIDMLYKSARATITPTYYPPATQGVYGPHAVYAPATPPHYGCLKTAKNTGADIN